MLSTPTLNLSPSTISPFHPHASSHTRRIRDDYTVYDPFGALNLLVELKSRWPATKLLISVGGGGFSTALWSRLVASPANRATFIASTVAMMRSVNADGIDLDYEFPGEQQGGTRSEGSGLRGLLVLHVRPLGMLLP